MIVKYSPDKKIILSLKDKIISKEVYQDDVDSVIHCGEKKSDPKISVVIVAYNEGNDLIRNLENWGGQTNQDFEIILVDNGLDDETVEKIKSFDILYIKAKNNLGCCGGRNVGAVHANANILVFGDADGYNPSDYIEKTLQVMGNNDVIAIRGKVLPIDSDLQKEFMPMHYDLGNEKIPSLIDAEGNSAWQTNDYIKVGGFEDSLAGGEGVVLQYRMVEFFGYDKNAFVYDPKLILYHDYYRDDKKLEYKIRQGAIVQRQLHNKYPFIDQFIAHYSNKRKIMEGDVHSDVTNVKIDTINQEIQNEYDEILDEWKERRYQDVESIKNEKKYDFSIIIPCYNLGELLQKAIDSVFAQTLEDIEVIVVDDASPDEDTQVVLSEIEKNVQVVRLKENGGVSIARNEGVKLAKSEYILCLDADDTIEPTYLEKAKNIFDASDDVGLVGCWSQYFGDNDWLWKPKDKMDIVDALTASPVHTATCFRKNLHDAGGGYDANLRGYEDWDHWLRIMEQGCVVRIIPEALFNYYVRPGSKVKTSNKNSKELVAGIVNNHRELYEKYVDVVVAQKHYNWAMCDARCKDLEGQLRGGSNNIKIRFFKDRCLGTIVTAKKKIFS